METKAQQGATHVVSINRCYYPNDQFVIIGALVTSV